MALPETAAWALLIGVVLVAAVVGFRPLLARLAARNIGRRKSRVLIVVAGLLVGTAVISSSLVVGDTLSYIFLEDVYARLDALDELVSNTSHGRPFSFSEPHFHRMPPALGGAGRPLDVRAPPAAIGGPPGTAAYESGPSLCMDLRRQQARFQESGPSSLTRASNPVGLANRLTHPQRVP